MNGKFFLKVAIGCLILTSVQIAISLMTNLIFRLEDLPWTLLSNFLSCLVMGGCVVYSSLSGNKLILTTFIISFVIGSFNILIEAFIFNVTSWRETLTALGQHAFFFFTTSIALVYLLQRQTSQQADPITYQVRSYGGWIWRIVLCVIVYVLFYIIAGMILQLSFPGLMEYYKGKIPPLDLILTTQLFRGLIFTWIAILFLRYCSLGTFNRAIMTGLIFAVIGGIAPLLAPNELMPSNVRLAHGFEVGISNFLFGLLIGLILDHRAKTISRGEFAGA